MTDFIPVNEPLLDGNEKKYLLECIETGWISSEGPFVREFEEKFAARVGRKHGIAVCNGTAALDTAVEALGIGPGDEVILPTFTIISCILQIVRSGAIPVAVDSDPITWNMDVGQIESKITSRTKAILIVHIYGLPVDMDPVMDIAKRYGLMVLEDAAEAIGQTYRGKPCGSFGEVSTFSFYPNKHVTTGEGGMIVTDDDEIAETCRSLRNLCFRSGQRFVHHRLGWNFRMTNLQAALGVAQLERLDEFIERKRKLGINYRKLLGSLPGIEVQPERTEYAENIYWVFGVVLDEKKGVSADTVMGRLLQLGIGTRPFFYPLHCQPILRKMGYFKDAICPVAERLYVHGFYLPSGLGMSSRQISLVADSLMSVLA